MNSGKPIKRADIQMRDPFVLPAATERRYYLCGTTDRNCWDEKVGEGFDGYWSIDLETWQGPIPLFRPPAGFWATGNFWAPEMHHYHGQYYLFASFKAPGRCRGTQVLRSTSGGPLGPYAPISCSPVTPADWECLDGTLFVDDAGAPWMVFCHEWVQVGDGGICAIRLSDDLSCAVSDPITLFTATQAPWVRQVSCTFADGSKPSGFVTDGPFLVRSQGRLLMLWSSIGADGYALGIARSEGGALEGPWVQQATPLYGKDGGHGMIFRAFDGRLLLTLHTPNDTPNERPAYLAVVETGGTLIALQDQKENK